MTTSNKFFVGFIACLIAVIIFLSWKVGDNNSKNQAAQTALLKQEYLSHDTLIKVSAGNYEKLVNYFNSQTDLNSQLKTSNDVLSKQLQQQGDRILSLTNALLTLKDTISKGTGQVSKTDTNLINLSLNYPDAHDPFVTWSGSVDKKTAFYNGIWDFGKLPIHIILTEQKTGLWNTRLIGPEWLNLDSLTVNSLPPAQFQSEKEQNLEWLIGGGVMKSLDPTKPNAISFNGGISFMEIHYLTAGINTNNEFTLTYLYKFKKLVKQ